MRYYILSLALWVLPLCLSAQAYKIYDTEKQALCTIQDIVQSVATSDVLFFGEQHNDSIAHVLQEEIYKALLNEYETVALSLEMFETDGQLVLEEYLQDFITEGKMVNDANAWDNYATAYRPLVERARAKKQAVIAANAPRRYVNMVSRKGLAALNDLPKSSKSYLPPLPIRTDDADYLKRFQEIMGGVGHGSMSDNFFHAQCLWDASMGYQIFKHWKKNKKDLIFHLNGRFHTDYQQGTVTQLKGYKKKIQAKNISCFPAEDFDNPDWTIYAPQGNFIILTKG
ncbi:MAG: ChaN family lipoprotein [Bacteroidota bacterium]